MYEKIIATTKFINERTDGFKPEVGIVLGSGLGGLDKGDEPNKKALPLMVEYVRLLKLKPDKALG